MGICSSCLNSDRHKHSHADESDALLNDGQPQYGTSVDQDLHVNGERAFAQQEPDPETLRREREEMERICVGLSGKLMDVSASSHKYGAAFVDHRDEREASHPRVDYAQLLQATMSGSGQSKPNSSTPNSAKQTPEEMTEQNDERNDGLLEECNAEEAERMKVLAAQKMWLKNIVDADPVERRWDWNRVRPIDQKLTFSFDDF